MTIGPLIPICMSFLTFCILLGVTMTLTKQVAGLVSGYESAVITSDGGVIGSASVPPAQPAVLTTHTTNTTGSLTMSNSNHGIVTGQRIDIYWTGGQCYGAIAGTVAGEVVPIASVSGGSNLPTSSTPVTVGICTSVTFGVTGNNIQALVGIMPAGQNGYIVFNTGSADLTAWYMTSGFISDWVAGNSGSNPLAGDVTAVAYLSHNNTANAVTGITVAAVVQ
jgi:hypothetical protein